MSGRKAFSPVREGTELCCYPLDIDSCNFHISLFTSAARNPGEHLCPPLTSGQAGPQLAHEPYSRLRFKDWKSIVFYIFWSIAIDPFGTKIG